MIVSYAQNSEDVVLARAFGSLDGFYVDVGAAHPRYDSVTKHFYDRGWHGINVEPHPGFFALLEQERPRDLNLNVGLSDHEGTLTFYEHRELAGNSTFAPEVAAAYRAQGIELREHTIEVTTLADVCERHVEQEIDFLKIDVEGHEQAVLAGADFERFAPRALVVEAIEPTTQRQDAEAWESVVLDAGYTLALFDGINRLYVRENEPDLAMALRAPASSLDDYTPYRHVEEIDALNRALAERDAYVFERDTAIAAREEDLRIARARIDALVASLAEMRNRLRRSRRALADARLELQAAVRALSHGSAGDPS